MAYLNLQRCQKGDVNDVWDFRIVNGQNGEGIYCFLAGDNAMKDYYCKNGENLHSFKVDTKYVADLSKKNLDYWGVKAFIYNNPQYKAFIFTHQGHGIPSSKEVLITDPEIIILNKIDEIIGEEITAMHEGINVYHGSDKKFDTFDMGKVGSGDGKSLGGWGIYFSDSPEVSKRYYLPSGQFKEHELRNGNYFDLDAPLDDGQRILSALQRQGVDESELEEFQSDYMEYSEVTNKQVYDWLSFVLGGEKQASLFLKSIGYIGNTMMDKWESDARNYVVFDTSAIIS